MIVGRRAPRRGLAVLLHNGKESDDNLRGRTNENLTLSTLLSVVDVVEAIGLFPAERLGLASFE